MSKPSSSPLAGVFFALLGFGIFATHDAIIKSLGGSMGVIQILFFIYIFAFPWVSIVVLSDGAEGNFRPHHPFMLFARTVLGLASGGLAFYAFMTLPLAEVYGLLFTTPLIITILSVPILGERLGIFRIAAVLLGFAGVLVMLPLNSPTGLTLGHLSALLAAFSGALNSLITRKIGNDEREIVMIMLPMALSLIVLAILLQFDYNAPSLHNLYALMIIGAFSFFGQLCIVLAYQKSDAAVIAPMQYSQLIWAIVYGTIFFGEGVTTQQIIGATIIVASGLIILYRERKGPNSRNKPTSTFRNFRPGVVRNLVGFKKSKEK